MPTDSTQAADASQEAHQTATDAQNADSAHSEPQKNEFNARVAFDKTNERVNKIAAVVEKIDPDVITQIAEKLGVSKKEAEQKVETSPDVQSLVQSELWKSQNQGRIEKANKDGAYDKYLSEGIKPALALRLAEQDAGIRIDTSEQQRQKAISTADAPVDRSVEPEMPESLKGLMTPAQFKKIAHKAKNVQIIR